ncbi:hypothetical protein ACIBO5_50475 [Nonomuraea angiospora]|uniref:hypothetical protein n=1 Tax=Nonomuraea angiospora TaxID=46172 RepID=UPI0029A6F3CB|nr:hypothetical protein [Nonomuraea angiospora]MDX3099298.1 hypothetical protein [Nonomuraea angiospora]
MDPVVLAAATTVSVVFIVAVAAVVMVWLAARRTRSADLPAALDGVAVVIRAILGKK